MLIVKILRRVCWMVEKKITEGVKESRITRKSVLLNKANRANDTRLRASRKESRSLVHLVCELRNGRCTARCVKEKVLSTRWIIRGVTCNDKNIFYDYAKRTVQWNDHNETSKHVLKPELRQNNFINTGLSLALSVTVFWNLMRISMPKISASKGM